MKLILALDLKFYKINNRLDSNSNAELINSNYINDLEAINRVFNLSKKGKYANALNERRDEMLKQIIQKRNEQLEQINEFIQSSQQKGLTQFKTLADSIKLENLSFSSGIASVVESILFRARLTNPLQFAKLARYSKFMKNEKKICLSNAKNLIDITRDVFFNTVHALPSNRIFIYCPYTRNMVVLNKSGDLIHIKAFQKEFKYDVRVNATNIVVFDIRN
jgi:hypothetical protein